MDLKYELQEALGCGAEKCYLCMEGMIEMLCHIGLGAEHVKVGCGNLFKL